MKTSRYYYKAQLVGWSLYILISTAVFMLSDTPITISIIGGIYLVFALGLAFSHGYRYVIVKLGWLEKDIITLIPRVAVASMLLAVVFHSAYILIGNLTFNWELDFSWKDANLITWAMLFFIWNLFYFTYIFFQRFREEEIKNLQLESAKNEYELRRLRDQMNPHFIFNAMNTIRALVDEDPAKAKRAITQLSNVLRSSLQAGNQDLIPLEKELEIVRDYLEIEKARYEERLQVDWNIAKGTERALVPPLLIQTLVENGIKHGIAKLPNGGRIAIQTTEMIDVIEIDVYNSGNYRAENDSNEHSLGLKNTKNRLDLSFGKDAWLTIGNLNDLEVKTTVRLPLKRKTT